MSEKKPEKKQAKQATFDRTAVTVVKYGGRRYAPGEVVPFASEADADAAEAAGGVRG